MASWWQQGAQLDWSSSDSDGAIGGDREDEQSTPRRRKRRRVTASPRHSQGNMSPASYGNDSVEDTDGERELTSSDEEVTLGQQMQTSAASRPPPPEGSLQVVDLCPDGLDDFMSLRLEWSDEQFEALFQALGRTARSNVRAIAAQVPEKAFLEVCQMLGQWPLTTCWSQSQRV